MPNPEPATGAYPNLGTAVRAVAARTDKPCLVHLTVVDGQVWAATTAVDDVIVMFNPAEAMNLVALTALDYPASTVPADGYALALPQLDIAYLVDTAGQATTVALGPNPHPDPDTRDDVYNGLHAIVRADPYNQPPGHRVHTAFVVLDQIDPTSRPAAAPRHRRRRRHPRQAPTDGDRRRSHNHRRRGPTQTALT